MLKVRILKLVVLALLLPSFVFAYTVVRKKDGKVFTGELVRQTESEVTLKDRDGISITFRRDQIDWDKTTQEIRKEENTTTAGKLKFTMLDSETKVTTTKRKFTGEPITVDFKDVDLKDFFRFIADVSHMNMVLDPSVKGTLTLRMVQVPWDQVLDVVCKNFGLGYEIEGTIVDVGH